MRQGCLPAARCRLSLHSYTFEIGRGVVLKQGRDLTIFATGLCVSQACLAADLLEADGIDAEVVNIHTIKPLDEKLVVASAAKTKRVFTVEEHSIIGGLGAAVAETLGEQCPTKLTRLGVRDVFGESGRQTSFCISMSWMRKVFIKILKQICNYLKTTNSRACPGKMAVRAGSGTEECA